MKKHFNFGHVLILVAIIAIGVITSVQAKPTVALDPNGIAIPFCRTFTCQADTVVTGVAADSTAVPANAVEVTILVKDQIVYLRHRVSTTATQLNYVQIPAGIPITLPVQGSTYICYKALTGTAKIYFIWKKM